MMGLRAVCRKRGYEEGRLFYVRTGERKGRFMIVDRVVKAVAILKPKEVSIFALDPANATTMGHTVPPRSHG